MNEPIAITGVGCVTPFDHPGLARRLRARPRLPPAPRAPEHPDRLHLPVRVPARILAEQPACPAHSGQLAGDRTAALDELGMIWDVLEEAWMRAHQEACAWQQQHGHLEVPADVRTDDGTGLATWLTSQRSACRNGTLPAGRITLLEKIGFGWDVAEAQWMRRYRQLTDTLASCGGQRYLPPGSPDATWLENQRTAHRTGKLPTGKTALLEKAGIVLPRRHVALRLPGAAGIPRRSRTYPDSQGHPHPGRDRPGRLGHLLARPQGPAHRRSDPAARSARVPVELPPGCLAGPLPRSPRLQRPERPPQCHLPHTPGRMALLATQETPQRPANQRAGIWMASAAVSARHHQAVAVEVVDGDVAELGKQPLAHDDG
jgi:hypothetical protein